ncbi:hypothetical protein BDR26DRAFT_861101 [Obelidium mucronatum]|nr:hypothetical protein BDR26DRAFT_861101 [Obelidium mucronatum]
MSIIPLTLTLIFFTAGVAPETVPSNITLLSQLSNSPPCFAACALSSPTAAIPTETLIATVDAKFLYSFCAILVGKGNEAALVNCVASTCALSDSLAVSAILSNETLNTVVDSGCATVLDQQKGLSSATNKLVSSMKPPVTSGSIANARYFKPSLYLVLLFLLF